MQTGNGWRRGCFGIALFSLLITSTIAPAAGVDSPDVSSAPEVRVRYDKDKTELVPLKKDTAIFSNRTYKLTEYPSEIDGLPFTRRPAGKPCDAHLDCDPGATVYLIVQKILSDKVTANPAVQRLVESGWTPVSECQLVARSDKKSMALFKRSFTQSTQLTLSDPNWGGFIVLSRNLATASTVKKGAVDTSAAPTASSSASESHEDAFLDNKPIFGPTTKVAKRQSSIKCLELYEQPSGLALGRTSEAVLTITPGDASRLVNFRFVTPVDDDMRLARDDALRFVHLNYPNWLASNAELTFEDKYEKHSGGSVGAALTTLVLSTIQGFQIDPLAAMTGDIAANGRVLEVGGVYTKVRGAEAAKCRIVVLPADNFESLVNTESFIAEGQIPQIQVLGASYIADAIAIMRSDRDKKLSDALGSYERVQQKVAQDEKYLHTPDCIESLTKILSLAPQHLSAKLMLMEATGKRPKTLSAEASLYYVSAAVNPMLPVLSARGQEHQQLPSSSTVHPSLDDLEKLRPICDPSAAPLVEAWQRFIRTVASVQSGLASPQNLQTQAQSVVDAQTKMNMNAEVMQKMLKEGI